MCVVCWVGRNGTSAEVCVLGGQARTSAPLSPPQAHLRRLHGPVLLLQPHRRPQLRLRLRQPRLGRHQRLPRRQPALATAPLRRLARLFRLVSQAVEVQLAQRARNVGGFAAIHGSLWGGGRACGSAANDCELVHKPWAHMWDGTAPTAAQQRTSSAAASRSARCAPVSEATTTSTALRSASTPSS